MNKIKSLLLVPYMIWIVLFIIVPIIMIFYASLLDLEGNFSFENYKNFFTSSYLQMTLSSIWYAMIITFFCLIISYPLALVLSNSKHKEILLLLIILPTWINLLLKTYAFIGILSHDGLLNKMVQIFNVPSSEFLFTSTAFVIVSVYIYIPFMLLPIFNSMDEIPGNLIQASSDLGANYLTTFRRVIMPLTYEGVKTGIQITFIPALSLFMITRLIAGNKVVNLGTAIEEQFLVTQNYGMGSTIAVFLILAMALILIITKSKSENKEV
ncbi:ABC transporter permease [Mammaliicoccus stepanovicii]|uniref:PotB protein n=1 Tax=Mammaliicoccus stepanovicii TaxID=643214 RepID=A0A239ZP00_9STAP|nr:ABC transporter permease [Mammaliicoccus stepanovicii]PNZ79191.1 spermidine/putrescine ABC transporter permease [Mammaliicoccus stepanovicii]GGI41453.1 spermidine/putrescine ABC transporter permease [Mammaliicoccus stepanovicii]SNV72578.1 potB protein [Mammaliicoccus stepanovicii]